MSRGGIRSQTVENTAVGRGGNEFESGGIVVPGDGTIPAGTILKRENDGKFSPVTNLTTDTPSAIVPFDISNDRGTAELLSARVIISGPVRASLLNVGGYFITDYKLFDKIRRETTCIPIQGTDISRTE